jgi:1-acyl-sn-glycerol-3-phosphate acyltransferase
MKLGKVEKPSKFYASLKFYGKFVHDVFFYKKVTTIGLDNIPDDKPVIITPNHQNALMDALAVIYAQKGQPVFLARSDIFKNPLIAKFLFKIKILPVFRIRDGKEKMKLNDQIYAKSIEVLEHDRQIVIFPEAQHFNKKHVLKLKKGVFRISFMLEEKNNFEADIHIIPTGVYYSNYWNFRSKVVVKFGKPMTLEDYYEEYKEDPLKTISKVTHVLHEKIKEQVIHIEDLEYHDEYDLMRDVYNEEILNELSLKKSTENKLKADREIVKRLDLLKNENNTEYTNLMSKIKDYSQKIKELNIKDWVVSNGGKQKYLFFQLLLLVIGFPFFVYGFINNILAYLSPSLITKKLKDRQFTSSITYGFGIFVMPFIYLIQFAIVWIFVKVWYIALIYLLSAPFFGVLAFSIHRLFVKVKSVIRFKKIRKTDKGKEVMNLRNEIIKDLNKQKKRLS